VDASVREFQSFNSFVSCPTKPAAGVWEILRTSVETLPTNHPKLKIHTTQALYKAFPNLDLERFIVALKVRSSTGSLSCLGLFAQRLELTAILQQRRTHQQRRHHHHMSGLRMPYRATTCIMTIAKLDGVDTHSSHQSKPVGPLRHVEGWKRTFVSSFLPKVKCETHIVAILCSFL
jgi:hypothetical protein